MELKSGNVQTTTLIPLAVKANETLRKNTRIKDRIQTRTAAGHKIYGLMYSKGGVQ